MTTPAHAAPTESMTEMLDRHNLEVSQLSTRLTTDRQQILEALDGQDDACTAALHAMTLSARKEFNELVTRQDAEGLAAFGQGWVEIDQAAHRQDHLRRRVRVLLAAALRAGWVFAATAILLAW